MPLPKALRKLTPERLKNDARLRAVALRAGLIPPRTMHSPAESQLLARIAEGRAAAVEIGVYEGSSTVVLCRSLPKDATLDLIDPFTENALHPGWRGTAAATMAVVERAVRERGGPAVRWHVTTSEEAGRDWTQPFDLLFIDGDHTEAGCRLDWEMWHGHVRPGGVVAFHDAREGKDGGWGLPGPTAVVDSIFRSADAPADWRIAEELDTVVVVERTG